MLPNYIYKSSSRLNVYDVFLLVFLMALLSYAYVKVVNIPIASEVLQQIQNDNPDDIRLIENNRMQVLFMQERGWFFLVLACLVVPLILWIGLFNRGHKNKTYLGYKYNLTEKLARVKDELSFQERLFLKFQILTSNDLLIAEMLVDGLSSKEISSELNISQASANTARYRLRKKMQLSRETDLLVFLKNI